MISAMAPSTGNRLGIISLSLPGWIPPGGKVFLLKFVWLNGERRKKKSRQPRYVSLTKAAPTDQGDGKRRAGISQFHCRKIAA
jgi:hypothetical protein